MTTPFHAGFADELVKVALDPLVDLVGHRKQADVVMQHPPSDETLRSAYAKAHPAPPRPIPETARSAAYKAHPPPAPAGRAQETARSAAYKAHPPTPNVERPIPAGQDFRAASGPGAGRGAAYKPKSNVERPISSGQDFRAASGTVPPGRGAGYRKTHADAESPRATGTDVAAN